VSFYVELDYRKSVNDRYLCHFACHCHLNLSSFDPAEETGKVLLRLQLRTLRHAWPVPR
jgi:ABC-type uncharacterized transport system substrate-binding protein